MTVVKTLHTCLMDRLDALKGNSKNLVMLNIGVNILLEMLATVIPCSFRKITESMPVVLFDKSISEDD